MFDSNAHSNPARRAAVLPKLFVFDLDYTIWPYYVESQSPRSAPVAYPDVIGIMAALKAKGVRVAIASKSPATDLGRLFLERLGLLPQLCSIQIFSRHSKHEHFSRIQ